MWRKKVTVQYPEVKEIMPERFRGMQRLFIDRCIVCNLCVTACPTNAIVLQGGKDPETGKKCLEQYSISWERCIHCEFCSEACPTQALVFTAKTNAMAVYDRRSLIVDKDWLAQNHVYGNYQSDEELAVIKAEKEAKIAAAKEKALKAKADKEAQGIKATEIDKVNQATDKEAGEQS